jgi:hypothetical protein
MSKHKETIYNFYEQIKIIKNQRNALVSQIVQKIEKNL